MFGTMANDEGHLEIEDTLELFIKQIKNLKGSAIFMQPMNMSSCFNILSGELLLSQKTIKSLSTEVEELKLKNGSLLEENKWFAPLKTYRYPN